MSLKSHKSARLRPNSFKFFHDEFIAKHYRPAYLKVPSLKLLRPPCIPRLECRTPVGRMSIRAP